MCVRQASRRSSNGCDEVTLFEVRKLGLKTLLAEHGTKDQFFTSSDPRMLRRCRLRASRLALIRSAMASEISTDLVNWGSVAGGLPAFRTITLLSR